MCLILKLNSFKIIVTKSYLIIRTEMKCTDMSMSKIIILKTQGNLAKIMLLH